MKNTKQPLDELLPCPFCGEDSGDIERTALGRHRVFCSWCTANLGEGCDTKKAAITRWNARYEAQNLHKKVAAAPNVSLDELKSLQWNFEVYHANLLHKYPSEEGNNMHRKLIALREGLTAYSARSQSANAAEEMIIKLRRQLHYYLLAQSRMKDKWAEGDEKVKAALWKSLHSLEDKTCDLLNAWPLPNPPIKPLAQPNQPEANGDKEIV